MKTSLVYLLLLIFIIGCSKDDENPILGSYRMTSLNQSNCSDPLENFDITFGENGCGNFLIVEFCTTGSFTFSEDGKFSSNVEFSASGIGMIQDLSATGTYTVSDNTVEVCAPECETLNINGNTLSLVTDSDNCDQSIILTKI